MSGKESTASSRKIKWDEETIAEHDKLRGTRHKIVEPDTPYIVYDEEQDTAAEAVVLAAGGSARSASDLAREKQAESARPPVVLPGTPPSAVAGVVGSDASKHSLAANWDELQSKLEAHAAGGGKESGGGKTGETQEGGFKSEAAKKAAFKAKRKNHYNEFRMAKLLASQINDEDEDESEDEIISTRK